MRSDDGAVPLAQTGPERTDRSNLTILEAIDQRPARYPAMRLFGALPMRVTEDETSLFDRLLPMKQSDAPQRAARPMRTRCLVDGHMVVSRNAIDLERSMEQRRPSYRSTSTMMSNGLSLVMRWRTLMGSRPSMPPMTAAIGQSLFVLKF